MFDNILMGGQWLGKLHITSHIEIKEVVKLVIQEDSRPCMRIFKVKTK